MTKRTVYIHTIDGRPACFSGGQICYARFYGPGNTPAYSLKQIRDEQKLSRRYRRNRGFHSSSTYGYFRFRVDVERP